MPSMSSIGFSRCRFRRDGAASSNGRLCSRMVNLSPDSLFTDRSTLSPPVDADRPVWALCNLMQSKELRGSGSPVQNEPSEATRRRADAGTSFAALISQEILCLRSGHLLSPSKALCPTMIDMQVLMPATRNVLAVPSSQRDEA